MIVWFNNKITDIRRGDMGSRHGLKFWDRFDVTRYCFASMASLSPIVSKFFFNLEMADTHAGKEKEMEDWIRSIFPADKIGSISWKRVNWYNEHLEIRKEFDSVDDNTIYWATCEDYMFTDNNLNLIKEADDLVKNDPYPYTLLFPCHYPEQLARAISSLHEITSNKNFVAVMCRETIPGIFKKSSFYELLDNCHAEKPGRLMYCPENCILAEGGGVIGNDLLVFKGNTKLWSPTKELFRHYDGYNHVSIDPGKCPRLTIPNNFFEKNMVIKYGFNDRDPFSININPFKELVTVDPNGADYNHWLPDELPLFWKPYIKEIIINEDLNWEQLVKVRNQRFLNMARCMPPGQNCPNDWFLQWMR